MKVHLYFWNISLRKQKSIRRLLILECSSNIQNTLKKNEKCHGVKILGFYGPKLLTIYDDFSRLYNWFQSLVSSESRNENSAIFLFFLFLFFFPFFLLKYQKTFSVYLPFFPGIKEGKEKRGEREDERRNLQKLIWDCVPSSLSSPSFFSPSQAQSLNAQREGEKRGNRLGRSRHSEPGAGSLWSERIYAYLYYLLDSQSVV